MTTTTTLESTLQTVSTLAPVVALEYDAHQQAIQVERAAETAVLERAIEAARPALRALSSKIARTARSWDSSDVTSWFDERGVCLVDEYARDRWADGREQTRGSLTGYRLYLLQDGRFAEATREGSWSQWQGESSGWEATLQIKTCRAVMDEYDLHKLVGTLADLLVKQAGQRPQKTQAATDRAERLQALASLLQR